VTALLDQLALLLSAAGLVAGGLVLARTLDWRLALAAAVDLWTAAGLLRLAGPPSWSRLGAAAAVLVVRRLVAVGLRPGRVSLSRAGR
jgi:hypothetical protein